MRNHRKLIEKADLCLATARKLLKEVELYRPDVLYCPNAADFEFFARAQNRGEHRLPVDLEAVVAGGKPIIGYYGALASWFDYELVEYVAGKRKEYNFVLIGPDYDQTLKKSKILQMNNVFWLGPKKYHELISYLAFFDVAVIPFKINNITLSTNPIKLFEYLSAARPVVTTAMPECRQYPEVFVSKTPEDFAKNLDRALQVRNDKDFLARLVEVGRNNSWESRAREVAARF